MADPPDNRWLVVTVEAPSDPLKSAVAEGLLALGGTAVQEIGDAVTTYVRLPAELQAWTAAAEAQLRESVGDDSITIGCRVQEADDWSELWKRGLGPRRVGRHFIVAPSWTTPSPRSHDRVIILDPEMAFGTGEHATTRGALRFLEECVRPEQRVLDVGTGSGILAIGAAQLGATEVIGVDNDADAILNARANIVRNRVASAVRLEQGTVDEQYLAQFDDRPFDIIVANVLSSVLVPLLPAFERALCAGGFAILGGILEVEADDVLAACANTGFDVIAEDLEDEWWAVLLRRPRTAVS